MTVWILFLVKGVPVFVLSCQNLNFYRVPWHVCHTVPLSHSPLTCLTMSHDLSHNTPRLVCHTVPWLICHTVPWLVSQCPMTYLSYRPLTCLTMSHDLSVTPSLDLSPCHCRGRLTITWSSIVARYYCGIAWLTGYRTMKRLVGTVWQISHGTVWQTSQGTLWDKSRDSVTDKS